MKPKQKFSTIWETEETEESNDLVSQLEPHLTQSEQATATSSDSYDSTGFTHGRAGRYLTFLNIEEERKLKTVSPKHWKLFQDDSISQRTFSATYNTKIENKHCDRNRDSLNVASTRTSPREGTSKIGPENPQFWAIPTRASDN